MQVHNISQKKIQQAALCTHLTLAHELERLPVKPSHPHSCVLLADNSHTTAQAAVPLDECNAGVVLQGTRQRCVARCALALQGCMSTRNARVRGKSTKTTIGPGSAKPKTKPSLEPCTLESIATLEPMHLNTNFIWHGHTLKYASSGRLITFSTSQWQPLASLSLSLNLVSTRRPLPRSLHHTNTSTTSIPCLFIQRAKSQEDGRRKKVNKIHVVAANKQRGLAVVPMGFIPCWPPLSISSVYHTVYRTIERAHFRSGKCLLRTSLSTARCYATH